MIRQAQRAARNDSLLWLMTGILLFVGASASGYFVSLPYFSALFDGGTRFSAAEMESYQGEVPVYFANVRGNQMYDTGYTLETEPFMAFKYMEYFGALAVGDHLLLVKSSTPIDEKQVQYQGTLETMPANFRINIVDDIVRDQPELADTFLTVYVNLDGVSQNWHWYAGVVGTAALALGGIYMVLTALSRFGNPLNHPILKNLGRFGIETESVLQQIDADMQMSSEKLGELQLSRHWIVYRTTFSFQAARMDDVVWLYKYIYKTRSYGVVTTSKSVYSMVWDRYGILIKVPVKAILKKEEAADKILYNLGQRVP